MRIKDNEIATATCLSTMENQHVDGGIATVTDIQFSPIRNDTASANGILSPPTTPASTITPSESDFTPSANTSGKFKFFKDGKSILELWYHKNGERMYWIPVSKNSTYWPPTGPCTPCQEGSTSLSVSDDNSSIQSSPWQRDHCWKQPVPRKNVNRTLEFMMHRSRPRKTRLSSIAIRRRRRRPCELIKLDLMEKVKSEIKGPSLVKEFIPHVEECVNRMKSTNNSHITSGKLNVVIQKLVARIKSNPNFCRTDPGIVSPRKRILREMERVSLEEMGNSNKKHRARSVAINTVRNVVYEATATISGPAKLVTSIASAGASTTKSTSSHSISSILSRREEPSFLRNLLKSPTDAISEARYLTTQVLSSNDVRVPRPSHFSTPVASLSPPYQSKSIHYPQSVSPFHSPAYLYPNSQGFITSPPISHHPPYSTLRHNYRDSALWCMPSISSLPRQSVYSPSSIPHQPANLSPWVSMSHSSLQNYTVSENGADVPLNLSKH